MQQKSNAKQLVCFIGAAALLILAILRADYLVARIVNFSQDYGGGGYFLSYFLSMAGYAAMAVCLLLMGLQRKKNEKTLKIVIFAGTCGILLSKLVNLILGFILGSYFVWGYGYFEMRFTFLGMLPNLLKFIAYAVLMAIAAVTAFSDRKQGIKNLWFITPTLVLVSNILISALNVLYQYNWSGGYNAFSGGGFIQILLEIIATLAVGLVLANPQLLENFATNNGAGFDGDARYYGGGFDQSGEYGFNQSAGTTGFAGNAQDTETESFDNNEQNAETESFDGNAQDAETREFAGNTQNDGSGTAQNAETRYYSAPPRRPDGYFDMVAHVLLLIFTFGIWRLIWVYRTTEFLNRMPEEPNRSGVCQLLLCLFVPLYDIYWVYKSSQRIDKLSYYNNIRGEITLMCVLFQVFIPILAPIFMQDKLNSIVTKGNTR